MYGDVRLFILDQGGRIVAEPTLVKGSFDSPLNDYGEAEATLALHLIEGDPDELEAATVPWQSQLCLTVDDDPVWLGPVVKRRGGIGSSRSMVVIAREWEAWLARVSVAGITPTHEQEDDIDAYTLVKARIEDVCRKARDLGFTVPPIAGMAAQPGNVPTTVSVDWRYGDTQAVPSVWEELRDVVSQGVDVRFVPYWTGVNYTVRLQVTRYAKTADPSATLTLGEHLASAELVEDGDKQATRWNIVGAGDTAQFGPAPGANGLPMLEEWRSLPTVDDQAVLAARARTLYAATVLGELTADEVTVDRQCPKLRGGDTILLDIPPGLDSRAPEGRQVRARIQAVSWMIDGGLDVRVRLAAPWESDSQTRGATGLAGQVDAAPPAPPRDAIGVLRELRDGLALVDRRRSVLPAHTHPTGEVAGLDDALDQKATLGHNVNFAEVRLLYGQPVRWDTWKIGLFGADLAVYRQSPNGEVTESFPLWIDYPTGAVHLSSVQGGRWKGQVGAWGIVTVPLPASPTGHWSVDVQVISASGQGWATTHSVGSDSVTLIVWDGVAGVMSAGATIYVNWTAVAITNPPAAFAFDPDDPDDFDPTDPDRAGGPSR